MALGNYIAPGFGDWLTPRRNTLAGLGAGLLQGRPGAGVADGIQADDAYATMKKAEAERQGQINQTLKFFRDKGYMDLVAAAEGGSPLGPLWTDAINRGLPQPEAAPIKGIEINGRLVNPITGEEMGNFSDPAKPAAPPSGYRDNGDGTLSFIPGGPADPSTNAKTTEATRRNQQLAKVMMPEAESLLGKNGAGGTFDSLSDGGNQFATGVNVFGARPLQGFTAADFQQAQNSLKTIVASYLYSVSGATATDEEVQRQTDVLTPKPFEAPESVAQKKQRLQQMVEAVVEAANGTPMQQAGDVVDYSTYFGGQ
jgi:hypothetical protein